MAESSSAARYSACTTRSMASSRRHVVAEPQLDHGPGVEAARAGLDVVLLLVPAARDVVLEETALAAQEVVAGEQRHDGQALHGGGQVAAHHLPELVGLALEAEDGALHLLVVLELQLEQLHHLDGWPGRAGDGDAAEAVGREHLLHRLVRDEVPRGGPPIPRHDHTVGVPDAQDGGAVGDRELVWRLRQRVRRPRAPQQVSKAGPRVVGSREGRQRHTVRRLATTAQEQVRPRHGATGDPRCRRYTSARSRRSALSRSLPSPWLQSMQRNPRI